eukprot:8295445-Pyramimonas_sp.AAC.1
MVKDSASHTQYPPPAQLKGRTAGNRLRTIAYDVTIFATYLPPERGYADNGTISKHTKWVEE